MKRLNTLLLLMGASCLAWLIYRMGPRDLWHQLGGLGWGLVPLILAEGAANLVHTVGWRHCLQSSPSRVPLMRLFRIAMSGFAINYLTPTASLGGEVSKATLWSATHTAPRAVSSVLLDKLTTGFAHLLLAVVGSLFLLWRVNLPAQLWVAMAITTGLLTGGMAVFLALQMHGKIGSLCRWLVRHRLANGAISQFAQQLSKVDEALKRFYREHPRDLLLSVAWHLVGHSAALLHAWLFLRLIGAPAPLTTVAAAGFLSLWFDLLTFAVPLNLGALEGSRILVFKALGCTALLGMAFGVAVRIAQIFWAGFGLMSYARLASLPAEGSLSIRKTAPEELQPSD